MSWKNRDIFQMYSGFGLDRLALLFPNRSEVSYTNHPQKKTKTLETAHSAHTSSVLQAARFGNQDLLTRRPTRRADALDGLNEFLTLNHLAKDGMFAVEMGSGDRGDEELRSIAACMSDRFSHISERSRGRWWG